MPEGFSICCRFESAPKNRHETINRLFDAGSSVMREPRIFLILGPDIHTSAEQSWHSSKPVEELSLEAGLLFVYSAFEFSQQGGRFRCCVSLDEGPKAAVYNLSFLNFLLLGDSVYLVEQRLSQIYRAAASIGPCDVFAGPEVESMLARTRAN